MSITDRKGTMTTVNHKLIFVFQIIHNVADNCFVTLCSMEGSLGIFDKSEISEPMKLQNICL